MIAEAFVGLGAIFLLLGFWAGRKHDAERMKAFEEWLEDKRP